MTKIPKSALIALIAGIVVCISVTVVAIVVANSNRKDDGPITPDYPPQGTENNQTPIEGDSGAKIESPEGGGAIRVTFGTTATASLSAEKVTLYYANPQASNQNVQIFVVIPSKDGGDALVVAKSDLITPGNQVTELPLESYAKSLLGEGGYNAELIIKAFDPASNEKAMVDTKGELVLTVVQ